MLKLSIRIVFSIYIILINFVVVDRLQANENSICENALKRSGDQLASTPRSTRQTTRPSFTRASIAVHVAQYLKLHLRLPTAIELEAALREAEAELDGALSPTNDDDDLQNMLQPFFEAPSGLVALLEAERPRDLESVRRQALLEYAKAVKQRGQTLTVEQWLQSPSQRGNYARLVGVGQLFETMAQVHQAAQALSPASFRNSIDTSVYTEERMNRLLEALRTRRRIIVTTAVAGATVNRSFFNALLRFARQQDAEIFVYPANMMTTGLDPILLETPGVHVITQTVRINAQWRLDHIKITAKHTQPLQGLQRLLRSGENVVVGSPKLEYRRLPSVDNPIAEKALWTTGAITDPLYAGNLYIQARTDTIAAQDHVLGALILEKDEGGSGLTALPTTGTFHARQVEFLPERNGFVDLNRFYSQDAVSAERPEVMVMGDVHVGHTDQRLLAASLEMIQSFRPRHVVIHDLFNGDSISHHDRERLVTLSQRAERGELDVRAELTSVVTFLNALLRADSSLVIHITPSNHDAWLMRWVQSGRFVNDSPNARLGARLFLAAQEGRDPFEVALVEAGLEYPRRVRFHKTRESFKVGDEQVGRLVELNHHGHAGANGMRRLNAREFVTYAGRAVFGHSHVPERVNGIVNVGTSTPRVLSYSQEGFSSWGQGSALVGPSGHVQLLLLNNNHRWFATENLSNRSNARRGVALSAASTAPDARSPERFFFPGFPVALPNAQAPEGGVGQVDQYSHRGRGVLNR